LNAADPNRASAAPLIQTSGTQMNLSDLSTQDLLAGVALDAS
jgi:hypothetical protein